MEIEDTKKKRCGPYPEGAYSSAEKWQNVELVRGHAVLGVTSTLLGRKGYQSAALECGTYKAEKRTHVH